MIFQATCHEQLPQCKMATVKHTPSQVQQALLTRRAM